MPLLQAPLSPKPSSHCQQSTRPSRPKRGSPSGVARASYGALQRAPPTQKSAKVASHSASSSGVSLGGGFCLRSVSWGGAAGGRRARWRGRGLGAAAGWGFCSPRAATACSGRILHPSLQGRPGLPCQAMHTPQHPASLHTCGACFLEPSLWSQALHRARLCKPAGTHACRESRPCTQQPQARRRRRTHRQLSDALGGVVLGLARRRDAARRQPLPVKALKPPAWGRGGEGGEEGRLYSILQHAF